MNLSPRQSEIVELRSKGYLDKEIAAILGIGKRRVATHLSTVYSKMRRENLTWAKVIVPRPERKP